MAGEELGPEEIAYMPPLKPQVFAPFVDAK